jgi:hypothetical protein
MASTALRLTFRVDFNQTEGDCIVARRADASTTQPPRVGHQATMIDAEGNECEGIFVEVRPRTVLLRPGRHRQVELRFQVSSPRELGQSTS